VNANEDSFSKGDILICDVRISHWHARSGAKTNYEVVRVIEHRRAAMRIPFPGMAPTSGPGGGSLHP